MDGVLATLQQSAVEILRSDSYYARVDLLTEQLGDIGSRIKAALGKLGLCVIVLTPDAECQYSNAPGPILDPLKLVVDINEFVIKNRGANGSRIPASDMAEHTAWLLHYPNHANTRQDPFRLIAKRIRLVPDKSFLIYRVEFETAGTLAGIVTQQET